MPKQSSSSAYVSNILMIFSGSTAGGSGGRRSLRDPLRSRRAAPLSYYAALLRPPRIQ